MDGYCDDDDDGDRVLYIDPVSFNPKIRSNASNAVVSGGKATYRPSIFQYKRYKDSIDNSDWKVSNEYSGSNNVEDEVNFDLNNLHGTERSSVPSSLSYEVKEVSPLKQTSGAYRPKSVRVSVNMSSYENEQFNRTTVVPVSSLTDIALDRPAHWLSSSLPSASSKAKAMNSIKKRKHQLQGIDRYNLTQSLPKAQLMKTRVSDLIPLTGGLPAFQPSWMTQPAQCSSSSSMAKDNLEEDIVVESYHDEEGDTVAASYRFTHLVTQQQTPQLRHNSSAYSTPFRSTQSSNFYNSPPTCDHRPRNTVHKFSKAKIGSLKDKLQKVIRDTDANQNSLLMTNLNSNLHNPMDLQNLRNRIEKYFDCEVLEVLERQSQFVFAKVWIKEVWHKNEPTDIQINALRPNDMSIAVFRKESEAMSDQSNRLIKESLSLRLYDSFVIDLTEVNTPRTFFFVDSLKALKGIRQSMEKKSERELYQLIFAHIWEPLE